MLKVVGLRSANDAIGSRWLGQERDINYVPFSLTPCKGGRNLRYEVHGGPFAPAQCLHRDRRDMARLSAKEISGYTHRPQAAVAAQA